MSVKDRKGSKCKFCIHILTLILKTYVDKVFHFFFFFEKTSEYSLYALVFIVVAHKEYLMSKSIIENMLNL